MRPGTLVVEPHTEAAGNGPGLDARPLRGQNTSRGLWRVYERGKRKEAKGKID
jgi:hypothetical protein